MATTTTATVTGKIGPGNTLTAVVISNIDEFGFIPGTCIFKYRIGQKWNYIDIVAATTITITLSAAAGNYTVSVS